MPGTLHVTPPLPPVVPPVAPDARPGVPTARDKAGHVLAGVGCGVGAVVTFWGATVAWDNALWALVAACAVATAGLGAGACWLLVWPIVVDVRHSLRDFDSRDNYGYATTRFYQRQDKTLGMAATHLYTRAVPEDNRVVNGKTAAQVVRAELEREIEAVRTEMRTARYVATPDAVPLSRVPTVYQERVTERLPPQHTPYSPDERMVVEWACQGLRISQRACQDRGLPKERWQTATTALWGKGVLVKGERGEPYQRAPWAKTAALVSRALTGEE